MTFSLGISMTPPFRSSRLVSAGSQPTEQEAANECGDRRRRNRVLLGLRLRLRHNSAGACCRVIRPRAVAGRARAERLGLLADRLLDARDLLLRARLDVGLRRERSCRVAEVLARLVDFA